MDIPWEIHEGRIIPKICDGKVISRISSAKQVESVNEPGRNDVTIMLLIAKLSKIHTIEERPARVRFTC